MQVGKSGASWITQALLLLCGSISRAVPLTAAIFGAVVTSFFFAVNGLRREMAVRCPRTLSAFRPSLGCCALSCAISWCNKRGMS